MTESERVEQPTLTAFQNLVQEQLKTPGNSGSVLLVAPTGIGKTLAATAGLAQARKRTVYGVPLRALAGGIRDEIRGLQRDGAPIEAVVHHGNTQDSWLFSEEVVVTTYDQIVCAVPGLPLSLPLTAGHAVAGALLMSTLVLDEVHLAWGISSEALTILLGILQFRQNLGLKTVVMTATLPEPVAGLICDRLKMHPIIVGVTKGTKNDEGLAARNKNRHVTLSALKLKQQKADEKEVDLSGVAVLLKNRSGKRIYFANTVDRLQQMYDHLTRLGQDNASITVLHNRMPGSWRDQAEKTARKRFGKPDIAGDWILLTNQVAEAGLDISAPFVVSDPAPVDTLIQRTGRCARWFRADEQKGEFKVILPKSRFEDWAAPYLDKSVRLSLKKMTELLGETGEANLDWDAELKWISGAWSGVEGDDGKKQVERCFQKLPFSLNLFDRASQQRSPGMIARTFREILSVQVAVIESGANEHVFAEIEEKLRSGFDLDASSVSLGRGFGLIKDAKGTSRVARYREDELVVEKGPSYLASGDLLIVPSSVAYLHKAKGLCFGDSSEVPATILNSEFLPKAIRAGFEPNVSRRQSLLAHTAGVMKGVADRLTTEGDYRSTLVNILGHLEPEKNAEDLADAIAHLAILATGFHDLGKCTRRWQDRARAIDPGSPAGLIGRTANTSRKIGVPHTPQGFFAAVAAGDYALGDAPETRHLVRGIALAAARHHSSLLDPAAVRDYEFDPAEGSSEFVSQVLKLAGLDPEIGVSLLRAAQQQGSHSDVPLMLPNDDLFPIYAVIGRAVLLSDREDAAGKLLEEWRTHV